MTASHTAPATGAFIHPAVFYATDREYLASLVPFITDGLAAGQPVAVAVPGPRLDLLRTALGDQAGDVTLIDMQDAGRNPGRIIAAVLRRFADAHPEGHVRIIGEPIWPGRTEVEYPACAQHEALINLAFAGRDVTIACPYDTARLSGEVIADARATHPLLWEPDGRRTSAEYAPDVVVDRYNLPLDDRTDGGAEEFAEEFFVAVLDDVSPARRQAAVFARGLGLTDDRVAEVELIVTELVTNGVLHGGGACRSRLWRESGHLVCEVRDEGRFADPLAGRRPAPLDQIGGRGLLMIHDLADLVRVHTSDQGTTLRVLVRLDA
ncbi:sensor histidine kinase [Lentzea jiangxiensis]|uniref:Anti-sigma regulatory factor (Ser/Thr protein kinase) n=1 Tax=Lentzea jiangxiensis TaxID=641025 RepID=A0A1H0X521_9PSEU|nr:sensor histidine kinase [Lentzea jiangxiensis]SDP98002.1 Anti-sigma regulatory factor (Ser/Thr protein kinase) [Lentzea jiangxiensis]